MFCCFMYKCDFLNLQYLFVFFCFILLIKSCLMRYSLMLWVRSFGFFYSFLFTLIYLLTQLVAIWLKCKRYIFQPFENYLQNAYLHRQKCHCQFLFLNINIGIWNFPYKKSDWIFFIPIKIWLDEFVCLYFVCFVLFCFMKWKVCFSFSILLVYCLTVWCLFMYTKPKWKKVLKWPIDGFSRSKAKF